MVIHKFAHGKQKDNRRMLCLEYTLYHNQKKITIYLKSTLAKKS